jgi:cellulose synthase/poly-beta-1,6-N-acetylglucosamine synthase-like glycosyltransferase
MMFFTTAAIAILILTGPLLIELAILTLASFFDADEEGAGPARETAAVRLAVIVPAHNEEGLVGRCVRSVLAAAQQSASVLVIAHNCSDNTAREAQEAGARTLILNDPNRRGKGAALSYGFSVAMAEGFDGVLVVDADSVVSPNICEAVKSRFAAGAAAVQCRDEIRNAAPGIKSELMGLAFLAMNVVRPRGRKRLGLSAGLFGNGFGLSRAALEKVPYAAHSTTEDLEYHLELVLAGQRSVFINHAGVVSEAPDTSTGSSTQRARWEGGRLRMTLRWAPRLLSQVAQGRVRLLEPLLDLFSLPLAFEVALLVAGLCLPVSWLRIYAACGLAAILVHVMAAAASGPHMWKSMRVLAASPVYILWKLTLIPRILQNSRAGSSWVRTQRDLALKRESQ